MVEVTDAMVEAACAAHWPGTWPGDRDVHILDVRRYDMRKALEAALASPAEVVGAPPPEAHLRVKQLDWHRFPADGSRSFEGQNDQREYIARAIFPWGRAVFLMEKDGVFTLEDDPDLSYPTEQAVKDAAQARFDSWILAAVETAPPQPREDGL